MRFLAIDAINKQRACSEDLFDLVISEENKICIEENIGKKQLERCRSPDEERPSSIPYALFPSL